MFVCPRCFATVLDPEVHLRGTHQVTEEQQLQDVVRLAVDLLIAKAHKLSAETGWRREPAWLRAACAVDTLEGLIHNEDGLTRFIQMLQHQAEMRPAVVRVRVRQEVERMREEAARGDHPVG